jgi:hypothetical protein
VTVFDVSPLLPFNRAMAKDYVHIVSDPSLRKKAFQDNAVVANSYKKHLVSSVWQACSIISGFAHPTKCSGQTDLTHHIDMSDDEEETANWLAYHPLGSDLIHSM